MKRDTLTVLAEIDEQQVASLRDKLAQVDAQLTDGRFVPFADIDSLHFASFVIIEIPDALPCLVFEANFDGDTEAFVTELMAAPAGREALGEIFSHCVGCPESGDRLGAFLLAQNVGANCYYTGCPGRSARQVKQESALRHNVQHLIDEMPLRAGGGDPAPEAIHDAVRRKIGDIDLALRQRPFLVQHGRRILRGIWWVLKRLFRIYLFVIAVLLFAFVALAIAFGLLVTADLALALLQFDVGRAATAAVGSTLAETGQWLFWLVLPAVVIGGLIGLFLLTIRRHERQDLEHDHPWNSAHREQILERENGRGNIQNHFCSLTKVKAGRFRYLTLRTVLHTINLAGRIYWNRGKLGKIATIHFARWVIIERGNTHWLLFLTNYDGSWDSYLSDFIDQASNGVTAVWSNSEGFPRSKFLVLEGSRDEQRFKNYARNSQFPTLAWYQAYPTETVRNVDDNTDQREALCAAPGKADLDAWLRLV